MVRVTDRIYLKYIQNENSKWFIMNVGRILLYVRMQFNQISVLTDN